MDFMNPMPFDWQAYFYHEQEKQTLRRTAVACGVAIFVYLFASFGLALALTPVLTQFAASFSTPTGREIANEVGDGILYILTMVLPLLAVLLITKIPRKVAFPLRKPSPLLFTSGVFIGLGTSVVGVLSASLLLSVLETAGLSYNLPDTPLPVTIGGQLFYLFNLAVLPAIFEELLFRGAILQALRRFGDGFAILMSALIFALFHGNFVQFPNAFLLGLIMALFTVKTGSLWTGIALHFLNNFILSAVDFVLPANVSDIEYALVVMAIWAVYLALMLVGFLMLRAKNYRLFFLYPARTTLSKGERTENFLLQPACLVGTILLFLLCCVFFLI